jgi:hypothetical protein
MGLIIVNVSSGLFADFTSRAIRDRWNVSETALTAEDPTDAEREVCWEIGRAVRAVADFLRSPSARADGQNIPLFPHGRSESELQMTMAGANPDRETPAHLRQRPKEDWA